MLFNKNSIYLSSYNKNYLISKLTREEKVAIIFTQGPLDWIEKWYVASWINPTGKESDNYGVDMDEVIGRLEKKGLLRGYPFKNCLSNLGREIKDELESKSCFMYGVLNKAIEDNSHRK